MASSLSIEFYVSFITTDMKNKITYKYTLLKLVLLEGGVILNSVKHNLKTSK